MSTSELKRKREDEEGFEEKPAKAQKTEASQSAPDAATSKTPILHLEVKLEGSTFELELEFSAQKSFADLATTIIKEAGFRFLPIYSFHLDGEPFGTSKGVYYG
jgi:hypothetical protein